MVLVVLKISDRSSAQLGDGRFLLAVSGAIVSFGAIGTLAGNTIGYDCPLRKIGWACPGCGCGRAVTTLLSKGPVEMMAEQPTAGTLIVVLTLTTVLSFAFLLSKKMSSDQIYRVSIIAITLLGVAAISNFFYQVTQVGKV